MSENYNWSELSKNGADKVHAFRYYAAKGICEPDDMVLDLACGWGAGSAMLQRAAFQVIGIDYREDCIAYAQKNHPRVIFRQQDLNKLETLPKCDVAVSIETIEHLKDPQRFADMMKRASNRMIFVSTPIVPSKETNKDHLHDFAPGDIQKMFIDKNWEIVHWANLGNVYGNFIFRRV